MKSEIQAEEWARFIDFLERNLVVATIAKEPVFIQEMGKQLEVSKRWYINIYGEKTLKKWIKIING